MKNAINIEGTQTWVFALNGDIMKLPVYQDAMLVTFNPRGQWYSQVDKLLYRSPLGLRQDQPLLPYGEGMSSVFHDELRRLWLMRQELKGHGPALAGEIIHAKAKPHREIPFRDVIFALDPIGDGNGKLLPFGAVLQTAFEAVMTADVERICSPFMRSGFIAVADEEQRMAGLNREALIQDHARAVVMAARNCPDQYLHYTLVFYNDTNAVDEFASAVESF